METRTNERSETYSKTMILSCMSWEKRRQNLKRNYTQFVWKVDSRDGEVMWVLREDLRVHKCNKCCLLSVCVYRWANRLPPQAAQWSWMSMFLVCYFNRSILYMTCIFFPLIYNVFMHVVYHSPFPFDSHESDVVFHWENHVGLLWYSMCLCALKWVVSL